MGRAGSERINRALELRGIKLPYSAYPSTVEARLERRRRVLRDATRRLVGDLFSPLIQEGWGIDWATYHVDAPQRQEPEIDGYPDYEAAGEVAVIRDTRKSDPWPNIRILMNEYIESVGMSTDETGEVTEISDSDQGDDESAGHTGFLIQDLTINPRGIVYYALSGVFEGTDTQSLRYAPLFYVEPLESAPDENYLVVPSYRNVTRRFSMQTHIRHHRDIHPFGFRDNLLDQIDSLTTAQQILEHAEKQPQPYLWGTQATI